MWINTKTKQTYTLHQQIREACPNVSFPPNLTDEIIEPFDFVPVLPTAVSFDPMTQEAIELAPVQVGGNWVQAWKIEALTAEQIAQKAAADKAQRAAAVMAELAAADLKIIRALSEGDTARIQAHTKAQAALRAKLK